MTLSRRRGYVVWGVLGFTLVARVTGFLREMIIAVGFGFSRATDTFYQLAATPTYLLNYLGGPLTTTYIAWSNRPDAPDEPLRIRFVMRWLSMASLLVAIGFLIVVLALQAQHPGTGRAIIPAFLMAASCIAITAVGFGSAVASARAHFIEAQFVFFLNNLFFIMLIGAASLSARHSEEVELTSAFLCAAILAGLYSVRIIRRDGARSPAAASEESVKALRQSIRKTFLPMLGLASIETGAFVASQFFVLWLAARSGTGITSASTVAQRIAMTANSLVIGPLASVAMVQLARLPAEKASSYIVRMGGMTAGGLILLSVMIIAGSFFARGHDLGPSAMLIIGLVPAYCTWMVAQGVNMMMNRLSFARGTIRTYTAVTIAGYGIASIGRFLAWKAAGFATAIAVGGGIEIAAAAAIICVHARKGPSGA